MGLPVIVLHAMLALIISVLLYVVSFTAVAQNAPPSYQADADVYKVIFEDQNFRVILSTRKTGVRDKDHSHAIPSVAYLLTDCINRVYTPDGKTRENNEKAGTVRAVPLISSHSAENIGPADCQMLIVERK